MCGIFEIRLGRFRDIRDNTPRIGEYSSIARLTLWPRIPISMACLKEKADDSNDSWKGVIIDKFKIDYFLKQ